MYEKLFVIQVKLILGSYLDRGPLIGDRCFRGLVLEQVTDTTDSNNH